jgi:hypothetical protein
LKSVEKKKHGVRVALRVVCVGSRGGEKKVIQRRIDCILPMDVRVGVLGARWKNRQISVRDDGWCKKREMQHNHK